MGHRLSRSSSKYFFFNSRIHGTSIRFWFIIVQSWYKGPRSALIVFLLLMSKALRSKGPTRHCYRFSFYCFHFNYQRYSMILGLHLNSGFIPFYYARTMTALEFHLTSGLFLFSVSKAHDGTCISLKFRFLFFLVPNAHDVSWISTRNSRFN